MYLSKYIAVGDGKGPDGQAGCSVQAIGRWVGMLSGY